jgi:hypothetical protein
MEVPAGVDVWDDAQTCRGMLQRIRSPRDFLTLTLAEAGSRFAVNSTNDSEFERTTPTTDSEDTLNTPERRTDRCSIGTLMFLGTVLLSLSWIAGIRAGTTRHP